MNKQVEVHPVTDGEKIAAIISRVKEDGFAVEAARLQNIYNASHE